MNCLQRTAIAASLLAAASAHAMSGSVTVHWDTLAIELIDTNLADGITPTLSWSDRLTSSSVVLQEPLSSLGSTSVPDWTTPGGLAYSDASRQITTRFDATDLHVEGSADSGAATANRVYRYGGLQVSGDARIVVSVQAEAHTVLTPAEAAQSGSIGYVYADANLFFADSPSLRNALSPVAYMSAGLNPGGQDSFALLQTQLDLHGGEVAYLFTQPGVVIAPSAVPEPATTWLLLAGLVGIASRSAWRRR